jgi:hypothetical protein
MRRRPRDSGKSAAASANLATPLPPTNTAASSKAVPHSAPPQSKSLTADRARPLRLSPRIPHPQNASSDHRGTGGAFGIRRCAAGASAIPR